MSFETPKDRRSMPNIYRSLHKSHTNKVLIYKKNIQFFKDNLSVYVGPIVNRA